MQIIADLSIGQLQMYGIIFLLGSFAVATLSDLRRMSAQVEFTEIWAIFIAAFFILDVIKWKDSDHTMLFLKWILLGFFVLISNSKFGILFRIAKGDMLAVAAILILTPFFLGVIVIILMKIFDLMFRPILRRAGSGGFYPFMPVVFIGALTLFALEIYLGEGYSIPFSIPF